MYVKITDAYRQIIAIADKELVGQKFTEGNRQLDVKESFYKGDVKPVDEIKEIIEFGKKEDATFNIVGKRAIQLALDEKLITKESVGEIAKIPYTMILL